MKFFVPGCATVIAEGVVRVHALIVCRCGWRGGFGWRGSKSLAVHLFHFWCGLLAFGHGRELGDARSFLL